MQKSKLWILGLIAMILAGGLVLASCSDDPCCTADDFRAAMMSGTEEEGVANLPQCCQDVWEALLTDDDAGPGCCESAMREVFSED